MCSLDAGNVSIPDAGGAADVCTFVKSALRVAVTRRHLRLPIPPAGNVGVPFAGGAVDVCTSVKSVALIAMIRL